MVANSILVTGVQPALLQAVEEALALATHLRAAKPPARLVIGPGGQAGTMWATPVRLPQPGMGQDTQWLVDTRGQADPGQ
eukprot:11083661-Alexandrium_andersonii.AAC.1